MRLSAAISTLLLSSSLVAAQSTIDFSNIPIFPDLKRCLKAVFVLDYAISGYTIQKKIGCDTNECLCRPDTLEQAVTTAGSLAQTQCSNTNDKTSATSILTAYCSSLGFTNAVAVPTDNAGAAAVTIFATTTVAMVTQTVTVSAASSELLSPLLFGRGVVFGAATVAMAVAAILA
ncbi:hypothetical protein ABW21_db0201271 [Orbilia brochopaga]|nr:hypothetical protein ABW21_db0201271 [Drechslerella brochopaga]